VRSLRKNYIFFVFVIAFIVLSLLLCALSNALLSLSKHTTEVLEEIDAPLLIIDAGHGGIDGGTTGLNGALEKEINLEISQMLSFLLKASGYRVIETRTDDVLLSGNAVTHKKQADLDYRLSVAKANPEAVFISIHQNAFPLSSCKGMQVWFSPNDPRSAELAYAVQSTVKELLQPQNHRKIKQATSGIYLLRHMENQCILIECGFLSNEQECELLSNKAYQQKIALSIYRAICEKMPIVS
jgi:N-acetylmuramoyl-L-alanine amidase